MHQTLSIGETAARSGCQPSALRFYEDQGLIATTRTDGGQRRYDREVLRRIAFIRAAQRIGLSLGEIRTTLSSLPDGRTPTAKDWARLSKAWRPRLDAEIAALVALRDELDSCIGCGCLSLATCRLSNPGDVAGHLGPGARYLLGDTADDART